MQGLRVVISLEKIMVQLVLAAAVSACKSAVQVRVRVSKDACVLVLLVLGSLLAFVLPGGDKKSKSPGQTNEGG